MIKIYTYSNPYAIDDEQYWDEIKDLPQFCASQTMVNGIGKTYPHLKQNFQLSTIERLINVLYSDWANQHTKVKQMMCVDNAITAIDAENKFEDNIKKSLQFNTKSIVDSLRIFSELGLDPNDFMIDNINDDQKQLIQIYKKVHSQKEFVFSRNKTKEEIDLSILKSLETKNGVPSKNIIDKKSIVIHGIHQFSPSILCTIEDLEKFYNVILLFNYQEQYKGIYETWLNIYSLFDKYINTNSENQFTPTSLYVDSYKSNLLADYIGKIANGDTVDFSEDLSDVEILEFENNTEFANYCANIYEKALKVSQNEGNNKPVLANMSEQFYSPVGKVNDILRSYFPEQFGERHFLDYPIGHFFVATMNMWNDEERKVVIENFSDLKECLGSGIIVEENKGELLNIFNNVVAYFEAEKSLDDIIKRLKSLRKYVGFSSIEKNKVGYFVVTKTELNKLISALEEMNGIIMSFFEDFSAFGDNFKNFYNRVQKFITSKLSDWEDLDKEMLGVIRKLLEKLEKSDLPNGGSYSCLKQTMSYYLSQDENLNKGANWIVRGFNQIDGDILLSANQNPEKTLYHFCCLSDKNICDGYGNRLPWPLDTKFFECAHIPLDFKYQMFLKSKLEYKNFNKYALLYGLLFNRVPCKISYVKNDNNKVQDMFFIFKLLGLKVRKYKSYETSVLTTPLKIELETQNKNLTKLDEIKASICPYRFAIESIVQEQTIFRERFLIHHYMRVIMVNQCVGKLQGQPFNEEKTNAVILGEYAAISDKFRLTDNLEKTQLIASVYKDVKRFVFKGKYRMLLSEDYNKMNLKLDLLHTNQKEIEILNKEELIKMINSVEFSKRKGKHCTYCSSRDICLSYRD